MGWAYCEWAWLGVSGLWLVGVAMNDGTRLRAWAGKSGADVGGHG